METYTDFGASYLIQTFVNKINTKLLNIVELFHTSRISHFQKEHLAFYEMSDNLLFE